MVYCSSTHNYTKQLRPDSGCVDWHSYILLTLFMSPCAIAYMFSTKSQLHAATHTHSHKTHIHNQRQHLAVRKSDCNWHVIFKFNLLYSGASGAVRALFAWSLRRQNVILDYSTLCVYFIQCLCRHCDGFAIQNPISKPLRVVYTLLIITDSEEEPNYIQNSNWLIST